MESGRKWSTVVDYFLILSAIIGVGFASGKEICVFFYDFGSFSLLGLLAFGLLYIYLFWVVVYIKRKLKINSYSDLNTKIFGKFSVVLNIILLVNFSIASAGMLAGADYLFSTYFGVRFRVVSIVLSLITFLILLGGINKIKIIANIIVPVMIFIIVINFVGNVNPTNVNFPIVKGSGLVAIYYGLLFGVNNFIPALPILIESNLKMKGRLCVVLTICLIILFDILIFASNNFSTSMPMFELSANVGKWFYYVYFVALILALFSTLMICSNNTYNILVGKTKNSFVALMIVLFNFCVSNLGYEIIIKYLYVASAILSGVFVVAFIVLVCFGLCFDAGFNKKTHNSTLKKFKINLKIKSKYKIK